MAMTEEDKKFTAWHEAGHALVNVVLEHTHPLHKVTIIPRGQTLGSTMSLPEEDVLNHRRKEMLDFIAVMMAGRIAEEIVSGDISSGASGDIQQATSMARAMVCQWGMSDKLGMVQYGNDQRPGFPGPRHGAAQGLQRIHRAGNRRRSQTHHQRGLRPSPKILSTHNRDKLEIIANALLEYETLDGEQVERNCAHRHFHAAAARAEGRSALRAPSPPRRCRKCPSRCRRKLPGFGSPAPAPA